MAIYTDMKAVAQGRHGVFESSRMKATVVGHLYDALVRDASGVEIDVDNGVALKIGDFTGNGLQERYATVAKIKDKIAVTGTPAIVKDAFTKNQEAITNFYNPAGKDAKAYEVVTEDIFAVAKHQFTSTSQAAVNVGAYVVVDGNGAWVAQAAKPAADGYGFIGKVHSLALDNLDNLTMVRIECVQNVQL